MSSNDFASRTARPASCWVLAMLMVAACGGGDAPSPSPSASGSANPNANTTANTVASTPTASAPTPAVNGNPAGTCSVPAAAQAKDTSRPTTVVGNGTPASCTSAAVVAAVAQGGVVTFNCGADPVTITLQDTARVYNNKPDLVLDGGGKVTLSGAGQRRILYQNTCDPSLVWMSPRCDLDDSPKTTVQNITLVDGDASGQTYGRSDVYGGGAIFARGGRLSVVNARFLRNRCDAVGPDVGGGAIRATGMSTASPVHVSHSSFGSSDNPQDANVCANGAALSGLVSSYAVFNSTFHHNQAIGRGANPARAGTPGGGSGGAIYMDGNRMDLTMCGSVVAHNQANEGGGAIFFVSNDRTGTMTLRDSRFKANPSLGFETRGLPGMYVEAAAGHPVLSGVSFD